MIDTLKAIPVRALFARLFSLVFFVLAFTLVSTTVTNVVQSILSGEAMMQALIKGVNGSVIALAVYELAGNLYYPVAIIASTALLLAALGVFLKLAPNGQNGGES
ncbi:hypothetical protein LG325_02140 [Marinobacter nauticus]